MNTKSEPYHPKIPTDLLQQCNDFHHKFRSNCYTPPAKNKPQCNIPMIVDASNDTNDDTQPACHHKTPSTTTPFYTPAPLSNYSKEMAPKVSQSKRMTQLPQSAVATIKNLAPQMMQMMMHMQSNIPAPVQSTTETVEMTLFPASEHVC